MNCRTNPNIPCICLLGESRYGTRQNITHPEWTPYSQCLTQHGLRPPQKLSKRGCCANQYVDIHGQRKNIDMSFPFALIIYKPRKIERYFQTKERAILEAPRCGDWQIIHLPSGQILYEPRH